MHCARRGLDIHPPHSECIVNIVFNGLVGGSNFLSAVCKIYKRYNYSLIPYMFRRPTRHQRSEVSNTSYFHTDMSVHVSDMSVHVSDMSVCVLDVLGADHQRMQLSRIMTLGYAFICLFCEKQNRKHKKKLTCMTTNRLMRHCTWLPVIVLFCSCFKVMISFVTHT